MPAVSPDSDSPVASYLRTVCPELSAGLIERYVRAIAVTPILRSAALNDWLGQEVSLKLENRQFGLSFKWRGVWLRLQTLSAGRLAQGVVCVSGGNFGRAVARAARSLGVPATVFLPYTANPQALAAIRSCGARVCLTPNVEAAFEQAECFRRDQGAYLLEDLGDPMLASGYGSIVAELSEQLPGMGTMVASAGGGLLAAGLCRALAALHWPVRLCLAEPAWAPTVSAALRAGAPTPVPVHTRIATLGVPCMDAQTFATLAAAEVESDTVTDEQAFEAQQAVAKLTGLRVDPAAGCSLALLRKRPGVFEGRGEVCVLVCGGEEPGAV